MRAVRFRDRNIDFQTACVCCLRWAREMYPFERTFFFGKRSVLIQIPAPLCHIHLSLATKVSQAQRWCDRMAVILGGIFGCAVVAGLFQYWAATSQGAVITNALLALAVGASMGFTFWAAVHFGLTPLFASAESKKVINSLRVTRYDPNRGSIELTFVNETASELVRRANLEIVDEDLSGCRIYEISAHILSHDIRLNSNLATKVAMKHHPSLKDAEELLSPAIELIMARNGGEGCFYDLSAIAIREVAPGSI